MLKVKNLFLFSILTFFFSNSLPQSLNDSTAVIFIQELINDSDSLDRFLSPQDQFLVNRLGISYSGIKNKFLISNDLDPVVRQQLKLGTYKYDYQIQTDYDSENRSRLTIKIPGQNLKYEYYFNNSKIVSKQNIITAGWDKKVTKYFEFHISQPEFFNNYSAAILDSFVNRMLDMLKISKSEKLKLEANKIHYYLCQDESEVEKLTGFKARGMYYLPYDMIITSFNCHYHEILHLLINYKLKHLPLFTLPFLQEGFAVAFGGRGGFEPVTILSMGRFLLKSGFMDYKELLSKPEFYQVDASMSYPVSGLYILFLIDELGIDHFLDLYRKFSTDSDISTQIKFRAEDLLSDSLWIDFLQNINMTQYINLTDINESDVFELLKTDTNFTISSNREDYLFRTTGKVLLSIEHPVINYKSKLYSELINDLDYNRKKYLITANEDEVSVYNLYSNNLIAKYVKGFSLNPKPVIKKDGRFIFRIKKELFDEPIYFE